MSEQHETTETSEPLAWEQLVDLEPRLDRLMASVLAARPIRKRGFNFEGTWGRFKDPISDLVGYFRQDNCDPRLKTTQAYDIVYRKLWAVLHD